MALAGLGDLPDTILSRSVIVRMRRRAPDERVDPFRRRLHAAEGEALRERLNEWAATRITELNEAWPQMPEGVTDRDADVWEPLLAIADAAGGDWSERARVAAVALVAASKEGTPSLGVRLLSDLRGIFGDRDVMATEEVLRELCALPESVWADLKGKPLNDRGLAQRLRSYGIKSKSVRIGDATPKGYARADLMDTWRRYLSPPPIESATSATCATPDPDVLDAFEERAAILQFEAGLSRAEAERAAWADVYGGNE